MKVEIKLGRTGPQGEVIAVAVMASYVKGVYGVHKLDYSWEQWELVHVPTGLRVYAFKRLRDAKRVADLLPQFGERCSLNDTKGFGPGEIGQISDALKAATLTVHSEAK